MRIKTIRVGMLHTNCYAVFSESENKVMLIDPAFEHAKVERELDGVPVSCVVLTHGHFDHIYESGYYREEYGCPVIASEQEKPYFTTYELNSPGGMFPRGKNMVYNVDRWLNNGEKFTFCEYTFDVRVLPGHSLGGMILYCDGIVFGGDLLFHGSIGITDHAGGNKEDEISSLRKLLEYPDDTVVYPGHGIPTTIGDEKKSNPFIKMFIQ